MSTFKTLAKKMGHCSISSSSLKDGSACERREGEVLFSLGNGTG